eukprot:g3890.t1
MGNAVGRDVQLGRRRAKIRKQLAEGSFGTVFLAYDYSTSSNHALKQMRVQRDNLDMLAAARAEIRVMHRLPPHPNVARFVAASSMEDAHSVTFLILMEYCPGGGLNDLLDARRTRRLSEREVLTVMLHVASGVAHLHAQEPAIAHRDLKTENILYDGRGAFKLCDFGSSSTLNRVLETKAEIAAEEMIIQRTTTMAFRAPEMVDLYSRKRVCEQVDVWALGCLLYKVIFGATPFEDSGGNVERMGILNARYFMPPCRYSEPLLAIVRQTLVPVPDDRPPAREQPREVRAVAAAV